ncbi:helix-turn-helix transcriptional regulator [Streptomyces sp. DSM 44917]|uniref:Helix-turn-helix transcriptional regulator n=1 Tax=Streptomyces boetiae TaxID=3075541 RepID=A0ABU2LDL5_9ACTN|nr:helix-turn-helix transcriptional regulator [Streptomyces sp. DSM 44917]MDT0309581.1 helix-turn-helix transcriptional regulator [Streptomyces sp. DSM 44917]
MAEELPSALRLTFGKQCRLLRDSLHLSREQVGDSCGVSASMVGAVERAERIPDSQLIKSLDRALKANGLLASAIEGMSVEKYRTFFRDFVVLERQCFLLNAYAPLAIPGLLQTRDYARAIFRMSTAGLTDEQVEKEVEARIERQQVFQRDPRPLLTFVIEQSVLERPIGGREVMREQLEHLLFCARLHFVTVQIMPTARPEHAGLNGYMSLVTTKEHRHVAYLEFPGGSQLISERKRVATLDERYGMLRAQALSPEESAELIEKSMGAL